MPVEAGITALMAATIAVMITLEAAIMAVLALVLAVMHLLSWRWAMLMAAVLMVKAAMTKMMLVLTVVTAVQKNYCIRIIALHGI
jgi:hypothetical protein